MAKARTLELPIFIHRSPEEVFRAVSDPEMLTRWFVDRATLTLRKGGSYSFGWEGGPTHTGKVVEAKPGVRYTLTWQWPGKESLPATKLRLSVAAKAGGTVLKFTHSGFGTRGSWPELYEGAIRGWTYFMMNLKSVMETGKDLRSPDDW